MARFTIYILEPDTKPVPDEPGKRVTITLPEPPHQIETWEQLVAWFRNHPNVPFAFHTAILAIEATFHLSAKPR